MNIIENQSDVIIVGAGVIGIACAHYLVKEGYQVTFIDKATIGSACSYGNCGYVCPSHVLPLTEPGAVLTGLKSLFDSQAAFKIKPRLSIKLAKWLWQFGKRCRHKPMLSAAKSLKVLLDSSRIEYQQLLQELESEWWDKGLLYVFQSSHGLDEFAKADKLLTEEFDVAAEFINSDKLTYFEPALKSGLAGAYYYKNDMHLRPDSLISAWTSMLKGLGVNFIEGCQLINVNKSQGKIDSLTTSKGSIKANQYVIAAGAWSAQLTKELEFSIPIQPGKGYSVTMRKPEISPVHPMLLPEHRVGVTPFKEGYRLGSMMEFVGYDDSIPEWRIAQLKASATPYLREPFTDDIYEKWQGWRPMTWDSLPILGRAPTLSNVYMATGHNMLGLTLAPVTGKIIAELITEKTTHINIDPYLPNRF